MRNAFYTRFFVRKIGYIIFVPKSVHRASVRLSVCPSVCHLSCNCILTIGRSNFKLCRCIDHMMSIVLGDISCDLDPKVKVK